MIKKKTVEVVNRTVDKGKKCEYTELFGVFSGVNWGILTTTSSETKIISCIYIDAVCFEKENPSTQILVWASTGT